MSDAFNLLNPLVQKWVYKQEWADLRDIQKKAIIPILSGNTDVVISASTAAGKTEAAFLPACTGIAENVEGFGILYISPLKALINDQFRRLESLCEMLSMSVTPWHGDSPRSKKLQAKRNPEGILLITPESLESLLMRESGWMKEAFSSLQYIIIDEYHAFIGLERGFHLQSLMHRLEHLLERVDDPIPRVALSATLGDMDNVLASLRPNQSIPCTLIEGSETKSALKMQLRGYINPHIPSGLSAAQLEELPLSADELIVNDLYESLRGDSNLVFANSRRRTEKFAVMLSERCKQNLVPNEFFPHHGSLAKELREDLEARLQKENLPTTAVCTMTLELGIDIGKVKTVSQVTAPHSVASLRQRLGRSGRRGEAAILRMFIAESELTPQSSLSDCLRIELLQSVAMTRLLVSNKWYEPPDIDQFHLSTLFHQILAVIAQWGGVRAGQLWALLCEEGPFNKVNVSQFKALLISMGEQGIIIQLGSGELIIGDIGEKLVGHYTFYAVFKTPEEYRVLVNGKSLGTIPLDSMILPSQHIVFGGKRWLVCEVDVEKKAIHVKASKGGEPPKFGGAGMSVHDRVRQEMYKVYLNGEHRIETGERRLNFLDEKADDLFREGVRCFNDLSLGKTCLVGRGEGAYVIPWMGDKIVNTLVALLVRGEFKASAFGGIIEVMNASVELIAQYLQIVLSDAIPSNSQLAEMVKNKEIEKYDELLPEELLNDNYGAKAFDIESTMVWIEEAVALGRL